MILLSVVLLSASATFAEDVDDIAIGEVNDEIEVDDVLASEEVDTLNVADEAIIAENASQATDVVTKDTFFNYFDESGNLNTTSKELTFEGDFSGVNVSYIIIDKPITFIGKDAVFNGVSFVVSADNVVIDGFKLSMDNQDTSLLSFGDATNVTISNNVLDFKALDDTNSFAIFAYDVDNLKLLNNVITYVGNTSGSSINSAVYVYGDEKKSTNIIVDGNTFNISIPSVDVGYDEDYNSVIYNPGVSFLKCENITFANNMMDYKYSSAKGYADSVYAVVIGNGNFDYDEFDYVNVCKNVEVYNNNISILGHEHAYGIFMGVENFVISQNDVAVSSDSNHCIAVDIEGPSSNGMISNNSISAIAPKASYGVYAYQWMGPIENISIVENTIVGQSYAACGIEFITTDPTISKNGIYLYGNHTTGMAINANGKGIIDKNNVLSLGSNNGTDSTGDSLIHKESAGISVKGDVLIADNFITSTAIGVNLLLGGNINLTGNFIDVNATGDVDNAAIMADGMDALTVSKNIIIFTGNTNGKTINDGVLISETDNVVITNNSFILYLVSADVDWSSGVGKPVSEGIAIKNCDGAKFEGNDVNLVYSNATGYYDTIYAVDLGNSANSVISNNDIVATGHSYIYGITVTSANFTIENNNITAISDIYAAYAINPDAGASGVVKNNTLAAISPEVVYTVYSMMWGDPTGMDIDYIGNQLYGNAYYVNVFDIGGANENIINNTIIAEGNYTIAVYSGSINNTISGNIIRSLGSGEGNKTIPYTVNEIEAIKLSGANAVISDNYIESTGDYAIDLGNTASTVENSYVAAKKSVGASAIANAGSSAVITNNTPSLKVIIAAPKLFTQYVDGVVFPVSLLDENGEPIANATVFATINGVAYNETTDADGYAAFVPDLNAGAYDVAITFFGDNTYGPKSTTSMIIVDVSASEIVAPASKSVFLTTVKSGSYVTLTLKDMNDNGLGNKTVEITFNGKTKTYTTSELGVIKFKLSASKAGTYTLKMKFAGDNNYVGSDAKTTVKITKQATKITAKAKAFKAKTKTKKYAITLKDSQGKAIKKVKVTIKVGKKTYKATTNSKGKATFKITKLTKKGKYTATVKFAGNNYYKAVKKSVKITVK